MFDFQPVEVLNDIIIFIYFKIAFNYGQGLSRTDIIRISLFTQLTTNSADYYRLTCPGFAG